MFPAIRCHLSSSTEQSSERTANWSICCPGDELRAEPSQGLRQNGTSILGGNPSLRGNGLDLSVSHKHNATKLIKSQKGYRVTATNYYYKLS